MPSDHRINWIAREMQMLIKNVKVQFGTGTISGLPAATAGGTFGRKPRAGSKVIASLVFSILLMTVAEVIISHSISSASGACANSNTRVVRKSATSNGGHSLAMSATDDSTSAIM